MTDIEQLLNGTFPFVEDLLVTYREFFPVASAIKTDGSFSHVGTYDGDERPLSDKVLNDFKKAFKAKQADYKAITIYYDVTVVDPNTGQRTDAIAVFAETKYDIDAYTFFYPYVLTKEKGLEFSKSWKYVKEKEVFNV